jgi:pimeloyl-ACP methyl ester carboxylesterase
MSREWVLLRGLGREKKHSEVFLQKLADADPKAKITAIDLPGTGEFFKISSPATIAGIADFVQCHLPSERPEQRNIVGISLGGMVALELIHRYPDAYDNAVLINSSFRNLSSIFDRLQPEALWYMLKAIMAKSSEEREKEILNMVSNNPQRHDWAATWSQIAQQRPVSPTNFFKQLIAAANYDLPLTKPKVPLYLLTSDGDRMVKSDSSKKLAQHWELPIAIHATAGHELYIDDPDWVIKQLFTFCGK